jgi:transposase
VLSLEEHVMAITPLYPRVMGLDVHQSKLSACAIAEPADGTITVEHREFGAFQRDRRALAEWAKAFAPSVVVMESTGIYWKSPYAALERVGIVAWVVKVRHVKTVPGRKTAIADAQWLAILARAGLLRGSFIPPAEIRHLRLIARQRQKLGGMLSAEKKRRHKVLADAGIRLNVLVSDLHGQAGRAMVKAMIADQPVATLRNCAGRLQARRWDELSITGLAPAWRSSKLSLPGLSTSKA